MAQLSPRMRQLVQPHLSAIEPYDPAFSPVRINLSANENTYPLPQAVRDALDTALAATPVNRYPDPMANGLRDELASWHGVSRDQVCVGNGGDELLYNLLLAFGGTVDGRPRTLATFDPAFSEYAFFASLTQTACTPIARVPGSLTLPLDRLDEAASRDIVIVTSPNNPTGDVAPLDAIEHLCSRSRGIVMVDEAYAEFADEGTSAVGLIDRYPNLVVLRTLSKAFGAAGIRCGYVLASSDIIEVFAAVRQIYSVNVLTQAAATVAVRHRANFAPIVETVRRERARLLVRLNELPHVHALPSQGNFVLAGFPGQAGRASRIRERLRDEFSILVRDFTGASGLDNHLRITVGTPEENDAVIAALAALTCEEDA